MVLPSTEIKVGAFFLVIVAIVFWMFERVDDTPEKNGTWLQYTVYFDDATGLLDKTPVEAAGIRIGFIQAISLFGDKAKVELAIDPKVQMHADALVAIRDRGILGEKYINVFPGSLQKPLLPDRSTIANTTSKSAMAHAFDRFDSIAVYIESITKNLDVIIKEDITRESIRTILGNLELITRSVNEVALKVRGTVDQSDERLISIMDAVEKFTRDINSLYKDNALNIGRTIQHVEMASRRADSLLEKNQEQLGRGIDNTAKLTERLNELTAALQRITLEVEQGKGTVGKLLKDEKIADQINSTLEGVNTFLDRAKQTTTAIGYRGEMLADERQMQNIVQITLQPRPDKYFLLEFVDSPAFGDLKVKKTEWEVEGSPGQSTTLIEKTRDDDLTFSLQFCKELYDFTFRFGLIRSEGGFGLDYHLLDRKLAFSFEAFDFARIDRPQLRALATYNIYRQFLVAAGIDDMINSNKDKHVLYNGFVSLGVRFTDDDLKAVLSNLPMPGSL